MKRIFIALTLPLLTLVAMAQQKKELKIGDTLPPLVVEYYREGQVKKVPLSSFYKDRYTVIDFWATWCGACIKAMRKADSVSRHFDGKLKILPVTYEDAKTVSSFVKRNKVLKNLPLEYVVSDSVLMGGYFKFTSIPHEVWIDRMGIVRAITYPDDITSQNITTFISGRPLHLREKWENTSYDLFRSNLPAGDSDFLYRSVLTGYQPQFNHMIGASGAANTRNIKIDRFFAINQTILNMFWAAFTKSSSGAMRSNRFELHIKDTAALDPSLGSMEQTFKIKNECLYCYELRFPKRLSKEEFYSYLMEDLNRLFPYKASIEKRERSCWVLVNKEPSKNPGTIGGSPRNTWEAGHPRKMINQDIPTLVTYLDWNLDQLPVIDETNFSRTFDMDLDLITDPKSNYLDFERVRRSLNSYGFDLVKATRNIDVLVIQEKNE
jgi:thiol-disulfide isomerase/thioredoxin